MRLEKIAFRGASLFALLVKWLGDNITQIWDGWGVGHIRG